MKTEDGALAAYVKLRCFAAYMNPSIQLPEHIFKLAEALEGVESGKIKRLMIFMPPRHGKSHLTSEFFPAWYLGRNPDKYIIATSYSQELSDDFGRKVRNIMADESYKNIFPKVRLMQDSSSIKRFHTEQGGAYFASGVGGPITGRGAHVLLIDDPIKNKEDAESELYRKKIKDWYTSTAYTRLMPDGAVIIIQTRWHIDDLAGWLISEKSHEGWHILSMPAIDDDGKALWPSQYPIEALNNIRLNIGERDFMALYQQRPVALLGNEFNSSWIQYYNPQHGIQPEECNVWILVDPAGEKKSTSDYTAVAVVGLAPDNNYYILEMFRDRLNPTERVQMVMRTHKKWNALCGRPPEVVYEKYGLMSDTHWIRQEQDRQGYRFSLVEVGGQLKKEDRIRRLIPLFEQKRIYLPMNHIYVDNKGQSNEMIQTFIKEEYETFPFSKHDDMLDVLARILDCNAYFPMLEHKRKDFMAEHREPREESWMDI